MCLTFQNGPLEQLWMQLVKVSLVPRLFLCSPLPPTAAFDYNFGATHDHENELGKVYQNMMFVSPSTFSIRSSQSQV